MTKKNHPYLLKKKGLIEKRIKEEERVETTVSVGTISISYIYLVSCVRPEKFQFMEKWQNHNLDYKIVISVKNPKFIL